LFNLATVWPVLRQSVVFSGKNLWDLPESLALKNSLEPAAAGGGGGVPIAIPGYRVMGGDRVGSFDIANFSRGSH
jgi:hypothetical protein